MKKGRLVLLLTIISLLAFVVAIPTGMTTSMLIIGKCVLSLIARHYPMDYVTYIGVSSAQLIPLAINALAMLISPILLLAALIILIIMSKKNKTATPSYVLVGLSMFSLLVAHLSTLLGIAGYIIIVFNHWSFYTGNGYALNLGRLFTSYYWILTLVSNLLYIVVCLIVLAYGLIPVLLFVISIILGIIQKIQDKKALKQQEAVEGEPTTEDEQPAQEEYDKLKEEQPAE